MENKARNNFVSLMAAKFYLKDMYGITMNDEDFVEKAMLILRTEIGTYETAQKKVVEIIVTPDSTVELPEPVNSIISVKTTDAKINEYGQTATATDNDGYTTYDIRRSYNPFILENNKNFTNSEYVNDLYYVTYEWENDLTLRIQDPSLVSHTIEIVYTVVPDGVNNVPEITLKQAMAIAARIAYMETVKMDFMGDPNASRRLQWIAGESARLISASRIPETLTNNELDRMADINMSHNRKQFGVPLKLGK